MKLTDYIKITKILQSNKDLDDNEILNNWISIVKIYNDEDASKYSVSKLNRIINEISINLNIETIEVKEIHKFSLDNEEYKVDTSVFGANVALFRDYNDLLKKHKDTEQIFHILCLLIYKDGEPDEYDFNRYSLNTKRLIDIDLHTAIGIVRFFFLLLKNYMDLSQISSEYQIQKENLVEMILTEL
jgi:hypothetical protein